MNKERTASLIFEGTITDEQIAKIPKDFHGDIIVKDNIVCTENCEIPGSLWLNGNVKAPYLKVNGDLFARDGIDIKTEKGMQISGDVVLKENCNIDTVNIDIGGDFEGNGKIDSTDINVYGKFKFNGEINLNCNKIHAGELEIDAIISKCTGMKTGWTPLN